MEGDADDAGPGFHGNIVEDILSSHETDLDVGASALLGVDGESGASLTDNNGDSHLGICVDMDGISQNSLIGNTTEDPGCGLLKGASTNEKALVKIRSARERALIPLKKKENYKFVKKIDYRSTASKKKKKKCDRKTSTKLKHFLSCPVCSAIFSNEDSYREHSKLHGRGQKTVHVVRNYKPLTLASHPSPSLLQSAMKNYKLSLSTAVSSEVNAIQSNELQPKKQKLEPSHFKCATCGAVFKTHELCLAHVVDKHKSTKIIKHQQLVQPSKETNVTSQERESVSTKADMPVQSEDSESDLKSVVKCTLCSICLLSEDAYSRHVADKHNTTPAMLPGKVLKVRVVKVPKEPHRSLRKTPGTMSLDDGFFCNQCKIKFLSLSMLSTHIVAVHGNRDPCPMPLKNKPVRVFTKEELTTLNISSSDYLPAAFKKVAVPSSPQAIIQEQGGDETTSGVKNSVLPSTEEEQAGRDGLDVQEMEVEEPITFLNPFTVCGVCGLEFKSFVAFKEHFDKRHPRKVRRPRKVNSPMHSAHQQAELTTALEIPQAMECDTPVVSKETNAAGVSTKFDITVQSEERTSDLKSVVKCTLCSICLPSEDAYSCHVTDKHKTTPAMLPGKILKVRVVKVPKDPQRSMRTPQGTMCFDDGFFCSKCKVKFPSMNMLLTHVVAIHGNSDPRPMLLKRKSLCVFTEEELADFNISSSDYIPAHQQGDPTNALDVPVARERDTTIVLQIPEHTCYICAKEYRSINSCGRHMSKVHHSDLSKLVEEVKQAEQRTVGDPSNRTQGGISRLKGGGSKTFYIV